MNGKDLVVFSAVLLIVAVMVVCVVIPAVHKDGDPRAAAEDAAELLRSGETGERVLCIDDNTDALEWRIRMIEAAEHELVLTSYSFADDESGRDVMAALAAASDRGVHVRIAVDGLSTIGSLDRSGYFRTLAGMDNVEVKVYNPVDLSNIHRLNYRMHDKYIITDDSIFMLGGRNTRNVSLGGYQEEHDIDRDIVVFPAGDDEDNCVHQVKRYFERIWSSKECRDFTKRPEDEDPAAKLAQRYDRLKGLYPGAFEGIDMSGSYSAESVRLAVNPQNAGRKAPVLWDTVCAMMEEHSDICIQTPYIVCGKKMYGDLADVSGSADRMRIITNSQSSGANLAGIADYLNNKDELLETGAEIYERSGEHSAHTKTVVMDDDITVTGTMNFDMRSVYLDTEMMLVIRSGGLNSHIRKMDEEYIRQSRQLAENGNYIENEEYTDDEAGAGKKAACGVLRLVTLPLRHLI